LAAGSIRIGPCQHWSLFGVRRGLRPDLREATVIYVTALITALLFVYLGVALVRPEWF
jgi:K+-transporting ATPase KdpF subunit